MTNHVNAAPDEDVEYIPQYHGVDCSLCGTTLSRGIHVCASGLPPNQDEAWCVNFCPNCVIDIRDALPERERDEARAEVERLRSALIECRGIARGKREHALADRIQAVLDQCS